MCRLKFDYFNFDVVSTLYIQRIYCRKLIELFPLYSQCILIPAMAVERWLFVCRPAEAASILSGGKKYLFYIGVPLLSLLIPALFYADFLVYQLYPSRQLVRIYLNAPSTDGPFYNEFITKVYFRISIYFAV